jgi:hypothetical protein
MTWVPQRGKNCAGSAASRASRTRPTCPTVARVPVPGADRHGLALDPATDRRAAGDRRRPPHAAAARARAAGAPASSRSMKRPGPRPYRPAWAGRLRPYAAGTFFTLAPSGRGGEQGGFPSVGAPVGCPVRRRRRRGRRGGPLPTPALESDRSCTRLEEEGPGREKKHRRSKDWLGPALGCRRGQWPGSCACPGSQQSHPVLPLIASAAY